jgi:uncharacterized protein YbjT (DUF2867 family)
MQSTQAHKENANKILSKIHKTWQLLQHRNNKSIDMEVPMYVIIGATGNTGSVIVNKLLARGKQVRAVGRKAEHLSQFKTAEPFVGDITDKKAMNKAFADAEAAYVMIPPNVSVPDFKSYQSEVAEALAQAIEKNEVQYIVTLSSLGADKSEKSGPILGLRHLEERLNRISGLNAMHLRAAYFMENTLGQAEAIKQMGYAAGPLRPELKFPIIATRDIGEFAGDALVQLDFAGQQVQELHGQRDLSYAEITSIIGKAIGKSNLNYVTLTGEQFRDAMMKHMGMSESTANLMEEMAESMDAGYLHPLEARSEKNTTPTSYEAFVKEEFLPAYQGKRVAA